MNFNERLTTLLQTPSLPLTWDSILQECYRIEADHDHIRSEFQWAIDYKRFQVEVDRGNRSAALIALKRAIATAPDNHDIMADYQNYVGRPAILDNIVLIISSKRNEAKALRLAAQFDKADIQFMIVTGSDTAPVQHLRALQVDASDSYEATPQKVVAAFAWVYENLGAAGVLKVDDDMTLQDAAALKRSLQRMAQENGYVGIPVQNAQFDRCAHWGKCRDDALNRRVYGRPIIRPWAVGSAYYLGPAPLAKALFSLMRFPGLFDGEYYEDKLIGDVLVFENVQLKPVNSYAELGLAVAGTSASAMSPAPKPFSAERGSQLRFSADKGAATTVSSPGPLQKLGSLKTGVLIKK